MAISLLGSLGIIFPGNFDLVFEEEALKLVKSIDFDDTLMHGMFSFPLFAGALHRDINRLAQQKWLIAVLGILKNAMVP